jgi:hypothetical protein
MKKAISISILVLFCAIFSAFSFAQSPSVFAQTIGTNSIDGIDIASSPANPTPGSNVTVSLDSYSTDLSGATISWSVNGKTLTKGVGMESITVVAPTTGKTLQVMATIVTVEGANIQKLISITSGSVDIVWESSGYVPPLYEGKAPFVYQNTVTFIAVPQLVDASGNPIDPKGLIYQWKENTFVLGSQSGYGKQSLTVTGSVIAEPLTINVIVSSADGSAHAEAQIKLQPQSPSIVFYEDDPLYGVLYNSSITGTLNLIHNQTKIIAAPYGFDVGAPGLVYNWSMNGSPQSNLSSSTSVVLGVNGGEQGSSNVDLNMQNDAQDILQSAESSFTAVFASQAAATTSNALF